MIYEYRCKRCGYTQELRFSIMTGPTPSVFYAHPCVGDDVCAEPRPSYSSELVRVYRPTNLNLGFRPVKHDQNDQWRFTNLD